MKYVSLACIFVCLFSLARIFVKQRESPVNAICRSDTTAIKKTPLFTTIISPPGTPTVIGMPKDSVTFTVSNLPPKAQGGYTIEILSSRHTTSDKPERICFDHLYPTNGKIQISMDYPKFPGF